MQYMLLIYGNEKARSEMLESASEEEQNAEMGRWFQYTQELRDSGAWVAGEALQPTTTAQTVMLRDGERLVTDGPFAETKEQLGGFYIVDVASKEEALDWAARIPSAPYGPVEVREVMTFEQP